MCIVCYGIVIPNLQADLNNNGNRNYTFDDARSATRNRYVHPGHKEDPVESCRGTPMSRRKLDREYSKKSIKRGETTHSGYSYQ